MIELFILALLMLAFIRLLPFLAPLLLVGFLADTTDLNGGALTMIAILGYLVVALFWEKYNKYMAAKKIEQEATKQLKIEEKKRMIEAKKLQLLNKGK